MSSETLVVSEIFGPTFQGEGPSTGRRCLFLRLAGCTLACTWCDTPYTWDWRGVNGVQFDPAREMKLLSVEEIVADLDRRGEKFLVVSGGEPMLQLDVPLVAALHAAGFQVAIETNGTLPVLDLLDWVCVSPKGGAPLQQRSGDELKLVYPQASLDPADFAGLPFRHFFLQPMDGRNVAVNTRLAVEYCLQHPQWRLSLQTHKLVGLP